MEKRPHMENRPQLPIYVAGDVIKIETFFRHEIDIDYVTASFMRDQGKHVIDLKGKPEPNNPSLDQRTSTASGPRLFKVSLETHVRATDPPGQYKCVGLTAYTALENEVPLEEEAPDLRFIVGLSPDILFGD